MIIFQKYIIFKIWKGKEAREEKMKSMYKGFTIRTVRKSVGRAVAHISYRVENSERECLAELDRLADAKAWIDSKERKIC